LFNANRNRPAYETHPEFFTNVMQSSFPADDIDELLNGVSAARSKTHHLFQGNRLGVLLNRQSAVRDALRPVRYDLPQHLEEDPDPQKQFQSERLPVLRLLLSLYFAAQRDLVYKSNGACQVCVEAIEEWLGSRSWNDCGECWDLDVRLHMVRVYQTMMMADTFYEQFTSGGGEG
jgi:hypothetical protein